MFLYTPESVYKMDKAAVVNDGLSEIELMRRAGECVWSSIGARWPGLSRMTVFAGSGNNGGDAFVVADLARRQGVFVQFIVKGDLTRQSKTACYFHDAWLAGNGTIETWQGQKIEGELIVDGLLGIGLTRTLDRDWQDLIESINQSVVPKVAIDIPSGLNAQTGVPQPCAIEAELTVTFIGKKAGHYLADGKDYCGELLFDDLGVSSATALSQKPALEVVDVANLCLPARRKHNSHKNSYGHILVIGGDRGMVGAAALAAQAALRSGAGMVSVLMHPDNVHSLASIPELMVQSWHEFEEKIAQASVVVVGPGLGHSELSKACLQGLSIANMPMVVDASALTPEFLSALSNKQLVITPHLGEAAGLLGSRTIDIQADRLAASEELSTRYTCVTVLKGSGSIIRQPGKTPAINIAGNPGMAVAGMGDVLAGIIGSFLGQGLSPFDAAKSAVYVHARCAELFAETQDESGLIASDIIRKIPEMVKLLRHA